MNTSKYAALAVLTICALAVPALGEAKKPVERPFKASAINIWTVSLLDGSGTGYETGMGTHIGSYANRAVAQWDLDHFVIVSGEGVVTAANGDQVFWIISQDQPGVVQIQGGTGRFKNATGWLMAAEALDPIVSIDWDTMTMTITITYSADGTLTY